MKLSQTRLARWLVLAAWAAFFDWLWLSGEWTRYVGPRTEWVVPFGAIALTLAALVYLPTIRARPGADRVGLREFAGLTAMVAPVLLVFAVPSPNLGSLAVHNKRSTKTPPKVASAPDKAVKTPGADQAPQATGDRQPAVVGQALPGHTARPAEREPEGVSLIDLSGAAQVPDSAEALGVREGAPVDMVAFVSEQPGTGGREMEISRFYTSCCAADGVPVSVKVVPDEALQALPRLSSDTWVRVTGVVGRAPNGVYRLVAKSVTRVSEPSAPYLAPAPTAEQPPPRAD